MDGWMDGRTDGQTDRQTDRQTNKQTNKQTSLANSYAYKSRQEAQLLQRDCTTHLTSLLDPNRRLLGIGERSLVTITEFVCSTIWTLQECEGLTDGRTDS